MKASLPGPNKSLVTARGVLGSPTLNFTNYDHFEFYLKYQLVELAKIEVKFRRGLKRPFI